MKITRNAIIISLLVIIGAALRFYNIASESLWLDEVSTYLFASNSFVGIWGSMVAGEFNPPLFYWMEHIMLTFFNPTEFVMRFLPAIAGIATIPFVYLLGKEIHNETTGLIAAFLFTISPWAVYYSQEARAYTTALLLFTIALIYYFRALKTNSDKCWYGFAVFAGIAFWTHFYALVFTVVLFAATYIVYRIKPYKSAILYVLICLPIFISAAWLVPYRVGLGSMFGDIGTDVIFQLFYQLSGLAGGAGAINGTIFAVLMCTGIYVLYKDDKKLAKLLSIFILGVIIISVVASYHITVIPRYLCYLLPILLILVATVYKVLEAKNVEGSMKYIMSIPIFLIIIGMSATAIVDINSEVIKPDWRSTAAYLDNAVPVGTTIVFIPSYSSQPFEFYYNSAAHGTVVYKAENLSEMERLSGIKGAIYVVSDIDEAFAPENQSMTAWLKEYGNKTQGFPDVSIYDIKKQKPG